MNFTNCFKLNNLNTYPTVQVADEAESQPKRNEYDQAVQITKVHENETIVHIQYGLIQEPVLGLIIAAKSMFRFLLHHVKLSRVCDR